MLIATFGAGTGWVGKTITYENEAFVLKGYGSIRAADVMDYDRQGHLVWVNEGTRAWVGAKANKERLVSPGVPVAASPGQYARPSAPAGDGGVKSPGPTTSAVPWWRQKYIVPAAVCIVIVVLASAAIAWNAKAQNERKAAEAAASAAAAAVATQKNAAAHAAMVSAVEPFLRLDAALDVGIVFADYTTLVQDAQYAVTSYAPTGATGRTVKEHLTKAAALYAAALDSWNSHIQYDSPENMQTSWAAASAEVDQANALATAQP